MTGDREITKTCSDMYWFEPVSQKNKRYHKRLRRRGIRRINKRVEQWLA